jgi:hypothetical protein
MGFRYQLKLTDGEDAGEASYGFEPGPGDEVYVNGAQRMRVVSVIPAAIVGEFVDKPAYGMLEVEPVDLVE